MFTIRSLPKYTENHAPERRAEASKETIDKSSIRSSGKRCHSQKKKPNIAQEIERQKEEFKQQPSEDVQIQGKKLTKDTGCKKAHREWVGPLDGKSERATEEQVCSREAQWFLCLSLYCWRYWGDFHTGPHSL